MISFRDIKNDIEQGLREMSAKERLQFYVTVGVGLFFILAVIF